MNSRFNSAADFRMSLETRLNRIAKKENLDIQRIRRQLAFDRFLSRIFFVHPDHFYLKGGYAMELIFSNARTTRDIDLVTLKRKNESFEKIEIFQILRDAVNVDMDDFFIFQISEPKRALENPVYGGVRFAVDALVDHRRFVNFRLDVVSDLLYDQPREMKTKDWLDFSDIKPSVIKIISLEQQIVEKLHAYSLPPIESNSRVKDLIDLILLINKNTLNIDQLMFILKRIFHIRKTHKIPIELPRPPSSWTASYEKLRKVCRIRDDLFQGFDKVNNFYLELLKKNALAELNSTPKQNV